MKKLKIISIKKQLKEFKETKIFLKDILNENQTPLCHSLAQRVLFILNEFESLLLSNSNSNSNFNSNSNLLTTSKKDKDKNENEDEDERFPEECEIEMNKIFEIIQEIETFYQIIMKTSWSSRIHLNLLSNENKAKELENKLDSILIQTIVNITKYKQTKQLNKENHSRSKQFNEFLIDILTSFRTILLVFILFLLIFSISSLIIT